MWGSCWVIRERGEAQRPGVGTVVPAGLGDVALQLRAVWMRTEQGQPVLKEQLRAFLRGRRDWKGLS